MSYGLVGHFWLQTFDYCFSTPCSARTELSTAKSESRWWRGAVTVIGSFWSFSLFGPRQQSQEKRSGCGRFSGQYGNHAEDLSATAVTALAAPGTPGLAGGAAGRAAGRQPAHRAP